MRNKFLRVMSIMALALIFCLSLFTTVFTQEETSASISGQVTDSTGSIVANATVEAKNLDTNTIRQTTSDADGNYFISSLMPGKYILTAELKGFKRYVQNITLNVKDRRQVSVVLEVGDVSETVTITDDPPLIQDSPTGQTLISNKQIVEIPLNNRDFLKLTELVPGISSDLSDETALGLSNRTSISINGMRRNGVNYLVDGVNNTDGGSNITLLSTPTIDSIKEFKVLSSNYTAELGRSGSGTITIVTKGGGNNYHGSLYEFFRNDKLNANTFFNNRRGRDAAGNPLASTPRLRYNNFGGTISGPVVLPWFGEGTPYWWKGTNKTFFFYSQDFRRINRATTTSTALVPTAAQRSGDFSSSLGLPLYLNGSTITTTVTATPLNVTDTNGATVQARVGMVFNPTNNRAYAGNIIPAADISPVAARLLNIYPLPNTGTNSFIYNATGIQNTRQEVVRIDHNFNDKNSIFGRYTHDLNTTQEPGGLFNGINLPNVATTDTSIPGQILAVSWTSLISPAVTNETAYNFSQNFIQSNLVGKGRLSDYGLSNGPGSIGQAFPQNNNGAIPSLTISGITFAGSTQGFSIRYRNQLIRDTLTWITGKHTFKFGGEWAWEGKNENASNTTQGSFTFDGLQSRGTTLIGATNTSISQSGIALASFLLGRANSYSEDQFDITFHLKLGRREFFAQDTWRILPNLTLDLGVRHQYFVPATDDNNVMSSFFPSLYDPAKAPTCANVTCTSLVRGTGDPLNGIGVAGSTSPFGKTIIPSDKNNFSPRVGLAYQPNFKEGFFHTLFGDSGKSVIRMGYGLYYDQIATFLYQDPTTPNRPYNNNAQYSSGSAGTVTFTDPTAGNLGNLPIIALGGIDPNLTTPIIQQWSVGIQREIFKNAVLDISYVGTKGDHLLRRRNINFVEPATFFKNQPTGCTPGTTSCQNLLRPYRGYGAINYLETEAISRYHGMLSSLTYRFATGSTITLAYTFSKNLTDFTNDRDAVDAPQNPYNMRIEYAEARTSRPHIFSASYVYEIPFFKKMENKFVKAMLDGWQIGGITNIESGPPVSRVLAFSTNGGLNGSRTNLVGDATGGLAGTLDANGLPYIFDPNAFANPAFPVRNADGSVTGTGYGNSGRAIFRLRGRNQTNLSLSRYFYFNRDKGRYIQFRTEAFNVFNHTQFLGLDNGIGTSTSGRPTATRNPREIQFALKFNF